MRSKDRGGKNIHVSLRGLSSASQYHIAILAEDEEGMKGGGDARKTGEIPGKEGIRSECREIKDLEMQVGGREMCCARTA